jgi:3-oxoadipate CoA-transferase alpha subunit
MRQTTSERSKIVRSAREAVAGIGDGSVVLVGGWGGIGVPEELILALAEKAPRNLVIATNNCGMGRRGDVGELFRAGSVAKVLTTFPVNPAATAFQERLEKGEVELEIVPQGTLAERLRAAGAGLGGFFTPTGAGTLLGEGKESRTIDGREHIFEEPLKGDFAIIRASMVDTLGNLRFRFAARGFSPIMAMAGRTTIVQADELVPAGTIEPDDVHLPGIFVDRILVRSDAR